MSTGVRPAYYPNYAATYPSRQAIYPYAAPYRPSSTVQPPAAYGSFRQNSAIPPRGSQAYQPNLLWFLKQQMGTRVINTSRHPVTLQQLQGKRDGEPVDAVPYANVPQTGVATVDGALQKTGDLVSFVPQAMGNVISSSVKGAFYAGSGATILSAGCIGIGKLMGRLSGVSNWALIGGTVGIGLLGSMLGGTFNFAKSVFNSLRDLKDILLGSR